jgi:predicted Zn-dependent peptidase
MHHLSKLKNGTTLITVPIKGTAATTILCMFPIGSRYEEDHIAGSSHFIEHLMFKGTLKRPTSAEITRILDSVGAQYNAFTSKEFTSYYVKIASIKQEVAFDVLSDMISNSEFKPEEVEKEKGAIIEELRMYKDNPLMDIEEVFENVMFANHPLGRDIGGSEDTVRGVSRQELFEFFQKHYSAKNMVLVVAGAINKKRMKKFLAYFADHTAPKNATTPDYYKKYLNPFTWPKEKLELAHRVNVKEKKVDQCQIMLGFPSVKMFHPDSVAIDLLATILGGGMSSRLFTEVREKRGLAYMVSASTTKYRDAGIVYVRAGIDPSRLTEAMKVIQDELHKISERGVTELELKNAQNYLIGHMALELEDSFSQANWFAEKQLFAPKIETYDHVVKKIKKVTLQQVNRLTKRLFKSEEMRVGAIGPFTKDQFLNMIEK